MVLTAITRCGAESDALGQTRLVLHCAHNVVFGISELHDFANVGNVDDGRAQLSSSGFYCRDGFRNRAYANGAAVAVDGALRRRPLTLGNETMRNAMLNRRSGNNEVHAR